MSVLVFHCAAIGGFTSRASLGVYTSRLDVGVSIFFLISGFLLYRPFADSHLTERTSPDVRKFWARRLLRIVPAYWLALTVLCFVFHAITLGPGWQGVVTHYGFGLTGALGGNRPGVDLGRIPLELTSPAFEPFLS